ncbi:MAG: 1-(5-phosphoribosyl)-5-[(5-phosphoribosylamino)methylideneamino] imidazole-4-carboxamide isomerase [Bacteroidaceae bacterium]|nr:1-(5-phosphoribosyl)-5-[(5-phosphoribosylamino)methylideneamino] imidazole-4-carboxamide isomerase [Bacteroidaceae bacterium]
MLPIPAIDLIGGKCVRLTKGDYATEKTYRDNPVDVAKEFEALGFPRLHLVDLDGARAGHVVNWDVLERIAQQTKLVLDFGGGLKTSDDVRTVFESGAQMVTLGSIAVRSPEQVEAWGMQYGHDKIIIGADALDGTVRIGGWEQESGISLADFIGDYYAKGFRRVLCTDISRDGMLGGPATELYASILDRFPGLKLIASGGVGSMADLVRLSEKSVPECVFGKAIYEGKIDLKEVAAQFLSPHFGTL